MDIYCYNNEENSCITLIWPSKQLRPILIACVIALVGIIFAYYYAGPAPKKVEVKGLAVIPNTAQQKILSLDTDNDNLKDWEETVWNTDSKNPDTDGDGTKDGDEIHGGRNPTVKAPNDSLKDSAYSSFPVNASSASSTSNTAEGRLGKVLFAEYMRYKQAGQEITPEIQADIVSRTLLSGNSAANISTQYTQKNIIVVPDTTAAYFDYGNAVGQIFISNSTGSNETELSVLENALATGNPDDLEKISGMIEIYKKIITALLKVKTPQTLSALHIRMINDYNTVISADEGMRSVLTNPLAGFQGLQNYIQTATDLGTTLSAIRSKISEQGIEYTSTQSGRALMNI